MAYQAILFGVEGSTNSVELRGQSERGSGDGSPLVRGSGGSCNLVQEISFQIVTFFLILNFRRVLIVVSFLLGKSPASVY